MKKTTGVDSYFAIFLILAVGNVGWFASRDAWNSIAFLLCCVAVASYLMTDKAAAIAAAIFAANLYDLSEGIQEGLKNQGKAKAKKPSQKDAFTDMLGSGSNLEQLMKRQTLLMSQLKNMAPLMQSAKEALKQLPAGYLEKALKTLKTNMGKNKVSDI